MARLAAPRLCVCTGPPLLASGPSARAAPKPRLLTLGEASASGPGSTPMALNVALMRPEPATDTSARLAGAPPESELPETIELIKLTVPPPLVLPMPPPAKPAVVLVELDVLAVMVLFWIVAVPPRPRNWTPPPLKAEFPEIVELVMTNP